MSCGTEGSSTYTAGSMCRASNPDCRWLLYSALALAVVDRVLKRLALAGHLRLDLGWLKLSLSLNRGIAFGWFRHLPAGLLVALQVGIIGAFTVLFLRVRDAYLKAGIFLIIVGAVGNFMDRLFYRCVVDYIRLVFFPPVFNLSDALITAGAVLVALKELGIIKDRMGV